MFCDTIIKANKTMGVIFVKDGFIKVATATPKIVVADCNHNKNAIIKLIDKAYENKVNFLCFPELCITGYTCSDLFLHHTLLDKSKDAVIEIAEYTKGKNMVVIIGAPVEYMDKLYNCAVVCVNGQILGIVPKLNLPTYAEFYESRQFTKAPDENLEIQFGKDKVLFGKNVIFECQTLKDFKFGVEICEDLWVCNSPSNTLAIAGANVIANLSASDEIIGKADFRRQLVSTQSAKLLCAYLYASAGEGESTTDLVFSGHSIIAENGYILKESKPFENEMLITEIDVKKLNHERRRTSTFVTDYSKDIKIISFSLNIVKSELTRKFAKKPFVPDDKHDRDNRCATILRMQAEGLKKRVLHSKSKTVVIGISGGLDSCLALLVAVKTMELLNRPKTDIIAVTMPCFGTTKRTKSNAEKLSNLLGTTLKCIDITKSVKQHLSDINHSIDNHDITFENAQARERTKVLMNIANMENGLVVGTGDLSELALGWATYNGDHMSMYGVNSSIPKTLVRHIVDYYANTTQSEIKDVLNDILDTPVSPELIPSKDGETIVQETENLVGPYELHDFFMYYILRFGFSPKKVYRVCKIAFSAEYDDETILKWLKNFYRRFFMQQFKRSCLPDGPKVGSITLSPRGDFRMPSDASGKIWLDELENL